MNKMDLAKEIIARSQRDHSKDLEFPEVYREGMLFAAMLVDEAAAQLANHAPGNAVAELSLLAARIEAMSSSYDTYTMEADPFE